MRRCGSAGEGHAVNLSDIAAKGGRPRWGSSASPLPRRKSLGGRVPLRGMRQAAAPHASSCGRDTSVSPPAGSSTSPAGRHDGSPLFAPAAKPGDLIAVTGALPQRGRARRPRGRAARGEPCLRGRARSRICDRPRACEGRWLGAAAGVHAMMDLSDGSARSRARLPGEAAVGPRVAIDRVPDGRRRARDRAGCRGRGPRLGRGGWRGLRLLLTCDQPRPRPRERPETSDGHHAHRHRGDRGAQGGGGLRGRRRTSGRHAGGLRALPCIA